MYHSWYHDKAQLHYVYQTKFNKYAMQTIAFHCQQHASTLLIELCNSVSMTVAVWVCL